MSRILRNVARVGLQAKKFQFEVVVHSLNFPNNTVSSSGTHSIVWKRGPHIGQTAYAKPTAAGNQIKWEESLTMTVTLYQDSKGKFQSKTCEFEIHFLQLKTGETNYEKLATLEIDLATFAGNDIAIFKEFIVKIKDSQANIQMTIKCSYLYAFDAEKDEEIKSSELDQILEVSHLRDGLEFKFLLLGAGESGKSTVLKQLRHIHRGKAAMTEDEILSYRTVLHSNTIESMKILVTSCDKLGVKLDGGYAEAVDAIRGLTLDSHFDVDVAEHIDRLWESTQIKSVYEQRNTFYLPDGAPFYFANVYRFADEEFVPTEEDIVMARVRTRGMQMVSIDAPPLTYNICDVGGQRSERKHWIRFFDNVQTIVFVVNLAGFDQRLLEDPTKNRLHEALDLFEQVGTTRSFAKTPIYLLLNKKDLFEELFQQKNIVECFPDYEGSSESVMEAMEFIAQKFKERLHPDASNLVGVHYIASRFKKDVKYTFDDIRKDIYQQHKKRIGQTLKKLNLTDNYTFEGYKAS